MRNSRGVHQGKFKPKHPLKYKGDPTKIFYRSGLELRVMKRFDGDDNVIQWSSEEIAIPYRSPRDNQIHRYFVDFYCKLRMPDGSIVERLIEVKPFEQTKPPRKRANRALYLEEIMTYGVNTRKWEAAEAYCARKGYQWTILTEKDILK